jgi:small subunit ribosomal protein S1
MVKELVRRFDADMGAVESEVQATLQATSKEALEKRYDDSVKTFQSDTIITGKVVRVLGSEVVVDIGYKSEGVISTEEFEDASKIEPGTSIEVLLELIEADTGLMLLSKRKADRQRGWERVIATYKEGDVVKGTVTRKIKGGLLVDIGVPVFLPASQVSIRRAGDIGEFIGKELECKIIKIDESRMNIVVSRRKLIEEQRERARSELLTGLEVGQTRKGVVKNLADFGAFVDLGGIDGLLHITDMSWGRIQHPSEMLKIEQEIEVKVLRFDRERNRIALGLKQLTPSPWEGIETRYPVASRHKGTVVNLMPYGAFVKLEDGVEGLVHVSEMSWTRRVNHPSEVVNINDEVEVVVLDINHNKQEISLGMKQTEANPWSMVEGNYPVGTVIEGQVRNLTNYGAFVELEEGIDGLLHVSDMSWTKKINHPSETLKIGDTVKAVVLSVDAEKKRVALGLKQLNEDPWKHAIPRRFSVGDCLSGAVTKSTNFGVFVELEDGLEGLLHISELGPKKVHSPEEVVRVGDKVQVRILKVDPEERKIGLTLIQVEERAPIPAVTEKPVEAEASAGEAAAAGDAAAEGEKSAADEKPTVADGAPPA